MAINWVEESDDLGPEQVLVVRHPPTGVEGYVVVDNTAAGPAIGGVRMAPDVTMAEVGRLARAMTMKNAAAGLPHGGAKAGILADPLMDPAQKENLIRWFARAIRHVLDYIPGPDMGTNETCMAWVQDEIHRCVGLPAVIGGIPLDEIGATGYGVAVAAGAAAGHAGIDLKGSRVVIQGYGAVGYHAARFFQDAGARIVAVSDSGGGTGHSEGLDPEALHTHKRSGRSVAEFPGGSPVSHEELIGVPCEIWVPAARPDVIHKDNAGAVQARLIVPGANIAVTEAAGVILHERQILVVPDFIANAGGVICAATEYHGGAREQAMTSIREKIADNTRSVMDNAKETGKLPATAARDLALARVREAATYRRHF